MAEFAFIPGESFNGAVARWADQVGEVEKMIDLTRFAGVRYGHLQRAASAEESDIRALAEEMKIDPAELLARAMPYEPGDPTNSRHPILFAGSMLPSLLIEKNKRRFSPAGLAASAHHRALWDLRLLPACVETGEILLDRCGEPDCKPTGWSVTLGIARCEHCMADLTKTVATRIAEETRATLAQLAGLFGHDENARLTTLSMLPPAVRALGTPDIVDLLARIVPVADRNLPTDLPSLLNAPAHDLSTAVALSWKALVSWPFGMDELASIHVARRTGRHNDGNGGRTMRFLTRKHQSGASGAVLDIIADWRKAISVNRPEGEALRESTVSGTYISRMTGIESEEVARLRRAGLFKVRFALDLDRPEARFDSAEVRDIAIALEDRCSIADARETLGISCHGVEQLVAMELLKESEHPFLEGRYGARQISRASLAALLDCVKTSSSPREPRTPISLRSAMKGVGGRVKPWGPVFAMLVSCELPFKLVEGELAVSDAITIDCSAVELLVSTHIAEKTMAALSPFMSKADAGELLNLNPAKTTALLRHFETRAGSHEKTVPLADAIRFAQRYMSAAEIATRRRVPAMRARSDALAANVPLLGMGGFCRRHAEAEFFGS